MVLRVLSLPSGSLLSEEAAPFSRIEHGPVHAVFLGTHTQPGGKSGFRALLVAADHSLRLLQQSKLVWSREEALASVQAATLVDLPARHASGHVAASGQTLVQWARLQFLQLKAQLKMASPEEEVELTSLRRLADKKNSFLWDKNGFRKLVVVLTRAGKVLALHNGDGRVVWSRYYADGLGNPRPLDSLLIWDTPHTLEGAPQLLLVGHDAAGPGFAAWLDAHSGAELRSQALRARVAAVLDLGLGPPTAVGARTVLVVFPDQGVQALSEGGSAGPMWARQFRDIYYHEIDHSENMVRGFGIRNGPTGLVAKEVWRMSLGVGERVVASASRPRDEAVHSQVRLLGDRSVLFRYLNPNTLLIALESASAGGNDLVVLLLDAVTGHVLHQVRHAGGRGPAHAALAENWAVYSFWNVAAQRVELCSLVRRAAAWGAKLQGMIKSRMTGSGA